MANKYEIRDLGWDNFSKTDIDFPVMSDCWEDDEAAKEQFQKLAPQAHSKQHVHGLLKLVKVPAGKRFASSPYKVIDTYIPIFALESSQEDLKAVVRRINTCAHQDEFSNPKAVMPVVGRYSAILKKIMLEKLSEEELHQVRLIVGQIRSLDPTI